MYLSAPARLLTALLLGSALVAGSVSMAPAQELTPEGQSRPSSFAELAEQVSPAVVNITTSTTVAERTGPQGIVPEGSPFEDFFRNLPDREGGPRRSSALGSGFIISADGFIVTNNHVIEGADEILIEFYDRGEELPAEVIGTDPNTDIALLQVELPEGEELPYVSFGDSSGESAEVGDWVMAMGNPLGQGFSVSAGIISARNRALSGTYDDYIQTDAAINRGNSGGPLFNLDGEVIGVNTAILSPNGGSIGIGFAMSSAVVTRVVEQLQEFGETRRGWLGVRIQDVTPDLADAIEGLEGTVGALVTDVPTGPAEDAGMLAGDVIIEFDGNDVTDTRELVRMVGNTAIGKEVEVIVLREGEEETLAVTLGRRETAEAAVPAAAQAPEAEESGQTELLGLSLSELTDELREELGVAEGIEGLAVLEVDELSEAFEKGLRAGDIITEAGQENVTAIADLTAQVEEARDEGRRSILLLVRRGTDPRFLALPVEE
ncbi:Do family serine endopeptidase [Aestuariibius sp. 2305UL40-4]|uniref:Do family serine endopeptidase n=1 Tax=Aestuariibius violaceus TaxID=3234132 RepID=UPI00398F5A08